MPRRRFFLYVLFFAVAIGAGAVELRTLLSGMPDYRTIEEYTPSLTTRVFDVHDELVGELSIERRALLTLSEIPVDLQNAVIATEDDRFFMHWGISPRGMLRAAVMNLIAGRVVQGGSTLTQQLAKLIFLTPERKLSRKLREILLAMQLERNFSKEEILQLYLNQIYFGHGAYGVQAAARVYFGKDVKQLTLSECALLAGLIKYPGGYSPFTYPERAAARRRLVVHRMLETGFARADEAQRALEEPVISSRPVMSGIQAPYFVENVRRRLEPKYGVSTLWRGGLQIHTTLDMNAQRVAESVMEKALAEFDVKALAEWERKLAEEAAAGIDPPTISTNPPPPIQGAFILMDVRSGAIRAMIGGRGDTQFNRATQARRQPGSTFKPFVWAAALQSGMTPMTLVEDAPLAYYSDGKDWRLLEGATDQYAINLATQPFAQSTDFKVWVPNNFDGKYLGVVTLRKGLALSRNLVSVRIIENVGPPQVVAIAKKAGIRSRLDAVLALGLGSSIVSPLEMANAFGTFANGGIHVEAFDVLSVEDPNGRVLEQHVPRETEAISPQTAYITTSLMKVVVDGGTATYAKRLKRPLAGKTGTTNDNRDLWFVGFTPDLVAGAWMGYDDPTATLGKRDWTGGSTVVPWWTEVMSEILKNYPPRDFPVPERIVFHKIDPDTGMLALPTCPKSARQAFLEGNEPTEECSVDHTRPLELAPEVQTTGEAQTDVLGPMEPLLSPTTGEVPADSGALPTDDELQRMGSEPEQEDPILIE